MFRQLASMALSASSLRKMRLALIDAIMLVRSSQSEGGKGNVMPYLLVRHKVEDYERWKPGFDEHGSVREQSGSKGGRLFRNAEDPNETVILLEWDNLENARQFAQSEDLRETMQRVGVSDQPDIYFLEEVEEVSV
jgi:heme-degrading monooxygenase HmoA